MRKYLSTLFVLVFLAAIAPNAIADELPRPVEKLAKGTVEVVKSPLSIYDHTKAGYDKSDIKLLGLFKGLAESPFVFIKKAGSGALDMATFPIE